MRIMGLDFGSKTTGVAVSDPLGITAQGIETITRKDENKLRQTCARIEELIRETYPDVKFVSYKDFGNFHDPSLEAQKMAELPGLIKKYGCDAVIVGNGC